jgi:hypothetical protein
MDRAALERQLAKAEEQIASREVQISQQREIIAELERNGRPADHAKYLLHGLELLLTAHRDSRDRLFKELARKSIN